MKTTIKNVSARVFLLFFSMLLGVYAMAQDAPSSQTESHAAVSHSESTTAAPDAAMWYANPIVWIVGGAVLLILIILAVRSGGGTTVVRDGGSSRTTTTTVRKD
ncbi:MAG: hypothetical protein JWQ38_1866 [Flavipsychrobacter sp.]|nr:hypothetical protein [Flavipsychrobacter sp.]